jgi:hypothetical protein
VTPIAVRVFVITVSVNAAAILKVSLFAPIVAPIEDTPAAARRYISRIVAASTEEIEEG